jgi:hypothetical protein
MYAAYAEQRMENVKAYGENFQHSHFGAISFPEAISMT